MNDILKTLQPSPSLPSVKRDIEELKNEYETNDKRRGEYERFQRKGAKIPDDIIFDCRKSSQSREDFNAWILRLHSQKRLRSEEKSSLKTVFSDMSLFPKVFFFL